MNSISASSQSAFQEIIMAGDQPREERELCTASVKDELSQMKVQIEAQRAERGGGQPSYPHISTSLSSPLAAETEREDSISSLRKELAFAKAEIIGLTDQVRACERSLLSTSTNMKQDNDQLKLENQCVRMENRLLRKKLEVDTIKPPGQPDMASPPDLHPTEKIKETSGRVKETRVLQLLEEFARRTSVKAYSSCMDVRQARSTGTTLRSKTKTASSSAAQRRGARASHSHVEFDQSLEDESGDLEEPSCTSSSNRKTAGALKASQSVPAFLRASRRQAAASSEDLLSSNMVFGGDSARSRTNESFTLIKPCKLLGKTKTDTAREKLVKPLLYQNKNWVQGSLRSNETFENEMAELDKSLQRRSGETVHSPKACNNTPFPSLFSAFEETKESWDASFGLAK
jgi:regulator of replication initiation timing